MNDDRIERLLEDAGPRPAIPEEDLASIREAARAEWRQRYGAEVSRSRARWWIPLVAAAAIVATVGIVWRARTRGPRQSVAPIVASVERAAVGSRWKVGQALSEGSAVEIGSEERLALRMTGGASARVDAGTRIRLASATLIELTRGAVYVDTRGGEGIAVRAPAGLFRPSGTQFEVRVRDDETRLKVREGSVRFEKDAETVRATAGEELVVGDDGRLVRRPIPLFGPEWEWILAAAPMPDIEGMKVGRFLEWIAREAGWRIGFADPRASALAESVDLHGSVEHLSPMDALGVVLSSAGLDYRVSDGTLVVGLSKKGSS